MRQAKKYWFDKSARRHYLFAIDEDGSLRKVYILHKPGMTDREIKMNLINRMQKKHGLHTEF